MNNTFSRIFLLLALIGIAGAGYFYFQRLAPLPTPQVTQDSAQRESKFAFPVGLTVTDLDINLQVIPAQLRGEKWDYTSRGVSYLVSSAIPGRPGNSIFYGHNWPNILSRLHQAQLGQVIKILFSDASVQEFKITGIREVSASEISILEATDAPRITLYTCTGFLDSRRLVVIAAPVE